jgi:CBS domain-containing protein
MQLKDIMTPEVERIHKDENLQKAAQRMKVLDVGLIPIYDGDRLVGMLTDRDITVRATAAGCHPATTPVGHVMTPEVVYCFEDQSVEEAATVMEDKQIRRLIVLNRDKRLVGVVALGDLATHTGARRAAGEAREEISTSGLSTTAQGLASAAAGKVSAATAAAGESAESVVDLVRRYPIPSLLLGVGIGYLLMPQSGNGGRRGYYDARTGSSTWSNMGSTMKQTAQDLVQNVAETAGGMKERAQDLASTTAGKVSDVTAVVGENAEPLVEMARRHPVPSLLLGLGLGYVLASSKR